jgi:hypothetical protein
MNTDRIDELAKQMDSLAAQIDKELGSTLLKANHREHDDGPYADLPDPPSDCSDNTDDDYFCGDLDDEDDEDDEDEVQKASQTDLINRNDSGNRPGALATSDHRQRRHKFEALVDKVQNEEGLPRSEAMAAARQRFPQVYRSYQAHTAGTNNIGKSAPPATFDDLVNEQMAKGCNYEVAAQRVMQAHGSNALRARPLAKRAHDLDDQFHKRAQDIWQADESLSRCESLRKARLSNKKLFEALQSV